MRRGELLVGFREEARTRAREPFLLSAPVAGNIDRIALEPGDTLTRGQVLVRLRPGAALLLDSRTRAETEARERAARSAIVAAERRVQAVAAELQQARQDEKRMRDMASAVAASERDRSASRVRALSAEKAAAEAETERARNEAQALAAALAGGAEGGEPTAIELLAPIDGILLKRHLQSAQPVAAGQPLLELAAREDLEIEVEVLSEDAVRLAVGGEVRLSRWGGEGELSAQVRSIDPSGYTKVSALGVEEQRTRVYASLLSKPEARSNLGFGYRVEALFVLNRFADALIVPGSALLRDQQGYGLYLIEQGRSRRVAVQLIGENDEEAAISGPIEAGAQIVAHPDDRVVDGVRVRAVR